jgi:hypothetical protein
MDRPPLTIELELPPASAGGADAAWRETVARAARERLRRRHGVVVFEGPGGVVQVGATADLRGFVLRRLVEAEGRDTDLGGVVSRVRAAEVGSRFEADCAYLEWARELTPETYRASLDRWRGWFVHLDPESELPVWRKTNLADEVGADPETLIGPIATKDGAARFGRGLDDLFSLCREPQLLAQRPNAAACSYKEMGACPAPCDGSEPMEAYRARAREALGLARAGAAVEAERLRSEMTRAASAMAFERAAELRVRGEAIERISKRGFRWATTLDRFAVVAIAASGRAGWARVLVHAGGDTSWWGDVDGKHATEAAKDLGRELERWSGGAHVPAGLTVARVERIGLVSAAAYARRKGEPSFLSLSFVERGASGYFSLESEEAAAVRAMRRVARLPVEDADRERLSTGSEERPRRALGEAGGAVGDGEHDG